MHQKIEIEKWINLYPIDNLRNQGRDYVLNRHQENPSYYPTKKALDDHITLMQPGGEIITSPYHIAVVEQLRAEVFGTRLPQDRVPTDVFVFSHGEPPRRDITKVGGLPYLPVGRIWPHRNQKPLTFIAQISFVDSKDITGNLPGDILLIFGDARAVNNTDASALHFQWVACKSSKQISAEDIPRPEFDVPPCFGSIYRTFDYPSSGDLFSNFKQSYLLDMIEGTKIGGVPRWIQNEEDLPGRFLCALGSISPKAGTPYPFMNQPDPLKRMDFSQRELMWGDVGSLYIFIDKEGRVHSAIQCY